MPVENFVLVALAPATATAGCANDDAFCIRMHWAFSISVPCLCLCPLTPAPVFSQDPLFQAQDDCLLQSRLRQVAISLSPLISPPFDLPSPFPPIAPLFAHVSGLPRAKLSHNDVFPQGLAEGKGMVLYRDPIAGDLEPPQCVCRSQQASRSLQQMTNKRMTSCPPQTHVLSFPGLDRIGRTIFCPNHPLGCAYCRVLQASSPVEGLRFVLCPRSASLAPSSRPAAHARPHAHIHGCQE